MSVIDRILRVGSMADSLRVYVPVMVLQKLLGLARVLLLAYLLADAQHEFGIWALGSMIFSIAFPIFTLGSHHALVRYVSFYEARGELRRFYRGIRWALLGICLLFGAVALAGSDLITRAVLIARPEAGELASYRNQLYVCYAAIANAVALALYHNVLGFMYGMRCYRLVSTVEVLFSIIFTAAATGVALLSPTGLAILLAHLGSVVITLIVGVCLLHAALRRHRIGEAGESEPVMLSSAADEDELPEPVTTTTGEDRHPLRSTGGLLRRILPFGFVALISNLLWHGTQYVSFWMTSVRVGQAAGGVFYAFLRLGQPLVLLPNAAWSVVFTYVARHWEVGNRSGAMLRLETAYKAVCLATMTLGVAVYAGVPFWVHILPTGWRYGHEVVQGVVLFFQTICNLSIVMMLAKLHERPIVMALAALAGGTLNVILADAWMAGLSGESAVAAAARAAGVGMFVGAGGLSAAYCLLTRTRLSIGAWIVMASPAILLLPVGYAAGGWTVVLAVSAVSPLVFDARQKRLVVAAGRNILGRLGGR